jgi:tRNA G37 N-methylase Trm5
MSISSILKSVLRYYYLRYIVKSPLPYLSYQAFSEYLVAENSRYEKYYIPPGGLQGKTVLDIGAEEGCTALFFFKHGAKRVICIESRPEAYANLKKNAEALKWDAVVINDVFKVEHLNYDVDFIKMNIEGYEAIILDLPIPKVPMVVEVHGLWLVDQFTNRRWHKASKDIILHCRAMLCNW